MLRQTLIRLALAGAILILPLYAYKVWIKTDYSDYDVYFAAATRVANGQFDQVYDFNRDGSNPYRYSPVTLPFFRPIAELPHREGRELWFFFQYLCYAAGFAILLRSLRRTGAKDATLAIAVAFLFTTRFFLDSFTIGQITGLMFLAFCLGLDAYLTQRPGWSGVALAIPSTLKVGPAILFSLLAAGGARSLIRAALATAGALAAIAMGLWAWAGTDGMLALWRGWFQILAHDTAYFDSSHYGSQSINSALLRVSKLGWFSWFTWGAAIALHKAVVVLGAGATLFVYFARKPQDARSSALLYAGGLMTYLCLMPQTFKYTLPVLAIPIALLVAGKKDRLDWVALGFGAMTLSLAGYDVIGPDAFFALQKASLPALALVLIAAATWRRAWIESKPRFEPEGNA